MRKSSFRRSWHSLDGILTGLAAGCVSDEAHWIHPKTIERISNPVRVNLITQLSKSYTSSTCFEFWISVFVICPSTWLRLVSLSNHLLFVNWPQSVIFPLPHSELRIQTPQSNCSVLMAHSCFLPPSNLFILSPSLFPDFRPLFSVIRHLSSAICPLTSTLSFPLQHSAFRIQTPLPSVLWLLTSDFWPLTSIVSILPSSF